jgi:hypothetical protein
MSRLGLNDGWSSDLMCGNFDLKTTVGNQLNGITSGFKDLMGNVIQGATGAVEHAGDGHPACQPGSV